MFTRRELETLIEKTHGLGRIRVNLFCAECGYSLLHLPYVHRCPECGNAYNAHATRFRGVRYNIEPEPWFWFIFVMVAWWGGAAVFIGSAALVFRQATADDSVVGLVFSTILGVPGAFLIRPGWLKLVEHRQRFRLIRRAADNHDSLAPPAE